MKFLSTWPVVGVLAIVALCSRLTGDDPRSTSSGGHDYAALYESLKYLHEIEEISWVEFESNSVYIGFNRRPSDLGLIVNSAALKGNLALDFGVHVWALGDALRSWRPGDGPYYCEATARYAELVDRCPHY